MKRKFLILLISLEAALLIALALLPNRFPVVFSSMIAFPFEQIAWGLKALCRTGRFGNGVAVSLWVGLSLVPAFFALRYREKGTWPERIALFVLSCVLLTAFYGMVNPQIFSSFITDADSLFLPAVKNVMGISVWSVAILYIVLRLIRLFRAGDKAILLRYFRVLLYVLCVLFTAWAVIPFAKEMIGCLSSEAKALDGIVSIMRLLIASVPHALAAAIVIRVLNLLEIVMTEDQQGMTAAAERLSGICCTALGVTAALTAAFNVLQIILMRSLSDVVVTADVPIVSLVFVAIVLLFSRLLVENKQLREDNSLFI